ncbi:MAG TPA: cation diffusion facilitator family transporter [Burkholderiales bacterium]|nr:cation diffusion facilitator family transporter [Burkholderiales bacterium]
MAEGAHRHHNHQHIPGTGKTLIVALVVTLGYASVEFVAGAAFHSLALMSDAGHMLSDALALGLAAFASWVGSRPAGTRHSYGFARAEIVAAFVNGLAMLVIVVVIAVEAVGRLLDPQPVSGLGVIVVAFFGLLANVLVAFLIGRGERNLNTRAALIHVVGDLIGSVAAITAGAVIYYTGWQPIDALLSLVIAILILGSTVRLVLDALHVLMEGVPAGLRLEEVGYAIGALAGVRAVHDLHVWNISAGQVALSAHVDLDNLDNWAPLLESARQMLKTRFGIAHVTLQPEPAGGINPGYRARVKIIAQHDDHGHDHEH